MTSSEQHNPARHFRKQRNLIINVKRQLPRHQQWLSNASTVMMWGMFLYLWRPVFHIALWMGSVHAGTRLLQSMGLIDAPGASLSLLQDVLPAVLASALLLMLWSRLPAIYTNALQHPADDTQQAQHFAINAEQLADARHTQVCVVHHDEQGKIIDIGRRG